MCRVKQFLASILIFMLLSFFFLFQTSLLAAVFTVNNTADVPDSNPGDGSCWTGNLSNLSDCTLRAAVMEANATPRWPGSDPHKINLGAGTYTLTLPGNDDNAYAGDLDITEATVIKGVGTGRTIINGNALDRIFDIRVSQNLPASSIEDLTLENGKSSSGGAICLASSRLILRNVVIRNNEAGMSGGGVLTDSGTKMYIFDSIFTNNHATLGAGGLHIHGVASIEKSSIGPGNTSAANAGGLYVSPSGYVPLFEESTVYGNSGRTGGISNGGHLSLRNSTVSGNIGTHSGGIFSGNDTYIELFNSTVAYNQADTAPGIETFGTAKLLVKNTLLSNNVITTGGVTLNCVYYAASTLTLLGVNMDSGDSCSFNGPDDIINMPARLESLKNNGGPTLTHALLSGSPAIDGGKDFCSDIDQRGIIRPQREACDIGAFEQDSFFFWPIFYPSFIRSPSSQ